MASTMADVFFLLFVVVSILLLSIAFDLFLTFLFTHPSTQEGRNFLIAIEDMVLPMGSFPSRLLNPWSPAPNPYNSNPLPPTSNSELKQKAVPAQDEPIPIHDRTNPAPILSFTPPMTLEIEPRAAANLSLTQLTAIDIEPQVAATSPAVNKVLAEFRAFEKEIRGLIDPEEKHSPQSKVTTELVADMIKNHAEVVKDLGHDWTEQKEGFEQVVQDQKPNYHELDVLYKHLSMQNERQVEKSLNLGIQVDYLNTQIEDERKATKKAVQKAEEAEQVAKAGVQKAIDEVRIGLEQNQELAENKIKQERDSVILSKRQTETELAEARSEVDLLKKQQKTATKANIATIRGFNETLRQKSLVITTSDQLAALAEQKLQNFIDEKSEKDSAKVTTLREQLRASKDLAKSLEPWKTKAEGQERICQRLRERLTDTENTIRENKDHVINDLQLEIKGLQRSMAADEATINRQHREISKLESGEEIQALKSKLKQATKQLKNGNLKNQNLRSGLRACEAKIKQDAENALKKTESRPEDDKQIANENTIQQASRKAELDAAEKEQEHKQHTRIAVEDTKKMAEVEASEKERQYLEAIRAANGNAAKMAEQRDEAMRAAYENATKMTEQHDEAIRAANENAAKMAEQRDEAMRAAYENATKMTEQHDEAIRAANENAAKMAEQRDEAMRAAYENATKMTEQHDEAMRAAVENATKMAVVNKKGGAAEEKTEADAEENTAPETKMDTEPDPEFQAMMEELDTAVKEQQRQKEIADAEKAEENARQQHQKEMAEKVQDAVRKALEEANDYHEKEKNKLIAANKAAEVARQTQEAPDKVTQTKSSDVVHRQTSGHPVDLTLAVTEADEANNLLEEVVKNGVAKGTIEHAALQRLTEIRLALHNVKKALQLPHPTTDTGYYADILRGFRLEESVLERLDTGTNHQSLVRQGRLANERLKKVSEILETSGVQKDALLQALLGPRREVKPIRGLKRPAQSKKPKVDNGQPPADVPPTPPAKPKADNRQSFASIMASLQNS